jgi:Rrf2 family nitric oxide-sensitive transcriptional repressor
MHITRYTDYSLRVLLYVALNGEKLCTIRQIAESYNISKNHLMKVVQELNNKGYLIALRGKNGGLRLSGKPEDIRIGTVVRDIEQGLVLVECFGDNNSCIITPSCQLKQVLSEALNAFFLVLDEYTLADLMSAGRQPELIQLLAMRG